MEEDDEDDQESIRNTRVDQGRRVIGSRRGNSCNEQVLSEREWLNLSSEQSGG